MTPDEEQQADMDIVLGDELLREIDHALVRLTCLRHELWLEAKTAIHVKVIFAHRSNGQRFRWLEAALKR